MNHLINKQQLLSIACDKKERNAQYSVKIHSKKFNAWYMKIIWKLQFEFADAKINFISFS